MEIQIRILDKYLAQKHWVAKKRYLSLPLWRLVIPYDTLWHSMTSCDVFRCQWRLLTSSDVFWRLLKSSDIICRLVSSHVVSCCLVSSRVASCRLVLPRVVSCHFVSSRVGRSVRFGISASRVLCVCVCVFFSRVSIRYSHTRRYNNYFKRSAHFASRQWRFGGLEAKKLSKYKQLKINESLK